MCKTVCFINVSMESTKVIFKIKNVFPQKTGSTIIGLIHNSPGKDDNHKSFLIRKHLEGFLTTPYSLLFRFIDVLFSSDHMFFMELEFRDWDSHCRKMVVVFTYCNHFCFYVCLESLSYWTIYLWLSFLVETLLRFPSTLINCVLWTNT